MKQQTLSDMEYSCRKKKMKRERCLVQINKCGYPFCSATCKPLLNKSLLRPRMSLFYCQATHLLSIQFICLDESAKPR